MRLLSACHGQPMSHRHGTTGQRKTAGSLRMAKSLVKQLPLDNYDHEGNTNDNRRTTSYMNTMPHGAPLLIPSSFRPTFAHLDRFLPPPELLCALLSSDLGVEFCDPGSVDVLQLVEAFPYPDGKTCCNCGTESSGFEHCWAFDWYANKICLGLLNISHLEGDILVRITNLHAQIRIRHSAINR